MRFPSSPKPEQSGDLLVKRYHVPPEFFGGPLEVGYYLEGSLGAGQTGQEDPRSPRPLLKRRTEGGSELSERPLELASGAGATSQSNLVQGTSTTPAALLTIAKLVRPCEQEHVCKAWGVQFPTVTLQWPRDLPAQRSGRIPEC